MPAKNQHLVLLSAFSVEFFQTIHAVGMVRPGGDMKAGIVVVVMLLLVTGCGWDGGPIINEDIGPAVDDSQPISLEVKKLLRQSPQTAIEAISVVMVSEDSVKLTGFVGDEATRVEAERLADSVPGVRFVVNALAVRR